MVLRVPEKTGAAGGRGCWCEGFPGAPRQQPPGRPPNLPPTPNAALATLSEAGPLPAGCRRACWRSPLLPQLLYPRFGVFDTLFSLAQWLTNLGVSSQNAAVGSAHWHAAQRQAGGTPPWPQIRRLATAQPALRRLGDETSFPPWGTLSSPWARRGHQPLGQTSGKRNGAPGFGGLASFTGRCWAPGQEAQLPSEPALACLTRVLEQTTPPILLIQDGTQDHSSAARQRFFARHTTRLTVFPWLSASPADHPIEKRWKKVHPAGPHRPYCPTFEALTDKGEPALLKLAHAPEERLSLGPLPTDMAKAA